MKFFKKRDLLIITAILIISAAAWIGYHQWVAGVDTKAEIYLDSKLIKTVDLGKETSFRVAQNKQVEFHVYEDGSIAFTHSDCPDKVCVNTGKISMVGQSAACLPNGLILKIVSEGKGADDEPDMVIGN